MGQLIETLSQTPMPTILVVAGIAFLFLSLGGDLGAKLITSRVHRLGAGVLGAAFLALGLLLYSIPEAESPDDGPRLENEPSTSTHSPTPESVKNPDCDAYAALAVRQYERNLANGCGLSGPRWQDNYDTHYAWCMTVPKDLREFETNARETELDRCSDIRIEPDFLENTNLLGGDIAGAVGFKPADCARACANDPNCVAWTFVRKGALPMIKRPDLVSFCALKNSRTLPRINDECCVSGFAPEVKATR